MFWPTPRILLGELGVRFEANANRKRRRRDAGGVGPLSDPRRRHLQGSGRRQCRVRRARQSRLGGVTGGALIIVGEDYGEGSSIMQERSHAFAMKSQVWLLDPRPNLPSIVKAVRDGFELSEASNTPVMLMVGSAPAT